MIKIDLFRTVATIALTLVTSGTLLFGTLAPAEAGTLLRTDATARIVA